MKKQVRLLLALVLLVLAAYLLDVPLPSAPDTPEINGFYKVMQVYDADTIAILQGGKRVSVRLIGIDSPEVETPYTRAECFGKEASIAARDLLDGQMVRIETDPTQDMYDTYQRLLAYVYVPTDAAPGGILANQYFVAEGYAREYTFREPYIHQNDFKTAESRAQKEKKGMWAECLPAQAGDAS
ncbi:MAG: thermonuclease family protein [Candidatus Pacebacteria bacterium]|nr:thermonuclease family protein [Candidatus Paceibacterota bacterium]